MFVVPREKWEGLSEESAVKVYKFDECNVYEI